MVTSGSKKTRWRRPKSKLEASKQHFGTTYLHALAVIEQHVAQLFGHHVQVPLLALVGPGQNVELGEGGGQIVERSGEDRNISLASSKC